MNIRTQSLVLVSLLASAGCSAVLPSVPQATGGSTVLAAAAHKISSKRTTFDAWDTDRDGKLSLTEYEAGFLSIIQPAPTPDQVPALKSLIDAEFNRLDTEGSGLLTYSEFKLPRASQLGQVAPADVLDGDAFIETTAPAGTAA